MRSGVVCVLLIAGVMFSSSGYGYDPVAVARGRADPEEEAKKIAREQQKEKDDKLAEAKRIKDEEDARIAKDQEDARIAKQKEDAKMAALKAEKRALEGPDVEELTDFCGDLKSSLSKTMDPLPIVEWLNLSSLSNFYQTTFHSLLRQEKYFNSINSLDRYNLEFEPYGLYSNFDLNGQNFKLATFGATLAGSLKFKEVWVLGAGVGYWHSNLDYGHHAIGVHSNTVYFGPYAAYLLQAGYIDLSLVGAYNMYSGGREITGEQKTSRDQNDWDVFAKLGGGYDFEVSPWENHFFIQPNADVSYLAVFQQGYDENGPDDLAASVGDRYVDFFRSRLAVQFWKEFYKKDLGFLIPSLTIGWVYMRPISQGAFSLDCGDVKGPSYPQSQQLYVGAKLACIHKRGILLSLGLDATIAQIYPVYAGNLRLEFDW